MAHLTTVDLSLEFLVKPQLLAVVEAGGEAIGISAPGPWVKSLTSAGIRHIPLSASTRGMSPLADLSAAFQLWRVLRREQITVLHTHNPKPGLYGRVLGRLCGVPLVVNTMHGFYATDDDPLPKRALVYSLEAFAARLSDVELHQNPEDLSLARRLAILPRGKGDLLGNGVNLDRFDSGTVGPEARRRVREDLGVADHEVLVGIVGRLVAEKGYPELFDAFAGLDDRYRLVVVGPDDPDKSDALARTAVAEAEEAGVLFLGMRTDVPELYSAMDVFVLPSHREGFPRAAMEGAAMGLPVVATDIRGCRQVVEHGRNGFLVPVNDPESIRAALHRLGEDAALRLEMGEASREISREMFDERRVVEIVMESYRQGLIDKGLAHLLPEVIAGESRPGSVRSAEKRQAPAIAAMHMSEIGSGFLPRLGHRFMKILYEALIDWPDAVVLVVEDDTGLVGFVSGVSSTGSFYRWFARHYGLRAALAAGLRLLINLPRAWESFRYGNEEVTVAAELLSMAVAPRARGKGLSFSLGKGLLERLAGMGTGGVRVVVGSENSRAIRAYRRLGFVDGWQVEVHPGETSEVLVWRG